MVAAEEIRLVVAVLSEMVCITNVQCAYHPLHQGYWSCYQLVKLAVKNSLVQSPPKYILFLFFKGLPLFIYFWRPYQKMVK